jgi:hypothetical protein
MFKLIESENTNPIRFPLKPGVKLSPGHIVKIVEHQGSLVTDLCDGYNAMGIIGNKCVSGERIDFSKCANIYPQRMIANVDRFDRKNPIEIGSSLYCNGRGTLSSKKLYKDSMILAKVITPASADKKYMQILWL